MIKKRVLFVCIHNSARSQMAEAWLNHFCSDTFEAHSAGLKPGTLNPLIVKVMKETKIDISHKGTQSVFDLIKTEKFFNYVITVCDETSAQRCPIFPNAQSRLHWSFPDLSKITGTEEEKLKKIRVIRDLIKDKIQSWCEQACVPA